MSNLKSKKIIPVVLCGGSGTRLWPRSRSENPKQFLSLLSEHSLIQETVLRAWRICGSAAGDLVTVTLGDLQEGVVQQLSVLDPDAAKHVLCEPSARDTAAAVAFAARYVSNVFGDDAIMWVLPADHHMGDEDAMASALEYAVSASDQGNLVTFGIEPTRPETGYGYIHTGDSLLDGAVYKVNTFKEKPDLETARRYVDSGAYLWNSGMFLFSAGFVLKQFEQLSADVLGVVDDAMDIAETALAPDANVYGKIKKEPFDKAIMEKSDTVAVVPCNPEWSDIGSWESLWEINDKDDDGNVGHGDTIFHATKNCFIQSDKRLVACAGVENIVVVETEDSILIADRSNGDAMKGLVNKLKEMKRPEVVKVLKAQVR